MIKFDRLWETMNTKGITMYRLREKCGIDRKTMRRLRANDNLETKTLNKLCSALDCSLEDIAESAAISDRECLRCFQASIHQSPVEYLIEYRVRAAAKLLETTDRPITEIAMATGWSSSSYFTKMFRRIYGKTPNEYRKERSALRRQTL